MGAGGLSCCSHSKPVGGADAWFPGLTAAVRHKEKDVEGAGEEDEHEHQSSKN